MFFSLYDKSELYMNLFRYTHLLGALLQTYTFFGCLMYSSVVAWFATCIANFRRVPVLIFKHIPVCIQGLKVLVALKIWLSTLLKNLIPFYNVPFWLLKQQGRRQNPNKPQE